MTNIFSRDSKTRNVCGDRVRLAGKDKVPTLNSDGRCPDIGESPMMLLPFVKRKMPYGDGYKYMSRYPLVNFSLISVSGICINIYIYIYSPWFLKMETIHQFRG